MKRKLFVIMLMMMVGILVACGSDKEDKSEPQNHEHESDELVELKVDFIIPEHVEVGETVELKAIVTYGDEKVTDAEEVVFEYWVKGNKEDSVMVDSENHGDGTYTAEVVFSEDAVYEMFAHTTAKDQHTMPLKSIIVGEGSSEDDHHDHESSDGFALHFMKPENAQAGKSVDLIVHLQLDGHPLRDVNVRYEITNDGESSWVDTDETSAGEYIGNYTFEQKGNYSVVIHVEDGEALHEHEEYEINVN
ncbi:FixH family protein [Bacillaceae bacterium W0354]